MVGAWFKRQISEIDCRQCAAGRSAALSCISAFPLPPSSRFPWPRERSGSTCRSDGAFFRPNQSSRPKRSSASLAPGRAKGDPTAAPAPSLPVPAGYAPALRASAVPLPFLPARPCARFHQSAFSRPRRAQSDRLPACLYAFLMKRFPLQIKPAASAACCKRRFPLPWGTLEPQASNLTRSFRPRTPSSLRVLQSILCENGIKSAIP